jgi:hypothetical protein
MTIFISYRRKDRDRVEALVTALEAEGVPVWLDRTETQAAPRAPCTRNTPRCARRTPPIDALTRSEHETRQTPEADQH